MTVFVEAMMMTLVFTWRLGRGRSRSPEVMSGSSPSFQLSYEVRHTSVHELDSKMRTGPALNVFVGYLGAPSGGSPNAHEVVVRGFDDTFFPFNGLVSFG